MSDLPQAIHPDFINRLRPEYIKFHNEHIAHRVPPHKLPWDPAIRHIPAPGGSPVQKVGSVRDIPLENHTIRVFTPSGSPPEKGWPVYIDIHGGGWALGGIETQNSLVTRQCNEHKCIAISVDYCLAPEHPYPAAVDDSVATLVWVYENGKAELSADVNRIAIGGNSSGGNLAAILALKAPQMNPPIPIIFQFLMVPVCDNTATVEGPYPSWKECQNTAWLTAERMMWFYNFYFLNKEDCSKWDASPMLAPDEILAKVAPAYIGIMELDVLRDEGIAYGERMQRLGVPVEIKVHKGVPHQVLAMDGALDCAREVSDDATRAIGEAFKKY
ncbi:hypothetical protein CONPUDRAFT_57021 [Coniophora puteana RWD-64-598 SS2]|uniref:Alpha/beta hydrolase fold-3 domain-containing protein n=1 Tax=Coniophora puteana (strain RWD-64-598) TaxID=741705 RepID=A0A5M3MNF0_CONPW|nr:uncharacterized protein CONPUDRAFT_57021 [Coniophora puteana RWD-64-598 SS2]EIW80577.1 hypothetical protein CONPUDRAFT_57021 [Coniophora puteana RWD-64-598 SS2]